MLSHLHVIIKVPAIKVWDYTVYKYISGASRDSTKANRAYEPIKSIVLSRNRFGNDRLVFI